MDQYLEIKEFTQLKTAYENGGLHPMDLKAMVTQELIKLLGPIHEHFQKPVLLSQNLHAWHESRQDHTMQLHFLDQFEWL